MLYVQWQKILDGFLMVVYLAGPCLACNRVNVCNKHICTMDVLGEHSEIWQLCYLFGAAAEGLQQKLSSCDQRAFSPLTTILKRHL